MNRTHGSVIVPVYGEAETIRDIVHEIYARHREIRSSCSTATGSIPPADVPRLPQQLDEYGLVVGRREDR